MKIHEYAGFKYYVDEDAVGVIRLRPVEGQHWSAAKDKHVRAAKDAYIAERNKRRRKNEVGRS